MGGDSKGKQLGFVYNFHHFQCPSLFHARSVVAVVTADLGN